MREIIFTDEDIDEIIRLSNKGYSAPKIIDIMGFKCSRDVIYRLLRKNIDYLNGRQLNNSYIYDDTYFEKIDTEQKAYWLGFLYADGNVHRRTVKVTLSTKDIDHLEKFNKHLRNTHPIYTIVQDSWGVETEVATATINSVKMCNDLIALGCVPCKSLTLKFPTESQVPSSLIRHFIRGYFDGDGSISSSRGRSEDSRVYCVSFTGTLNIVTNIKEHLGLDVALYSNPRCKEIYELGFGGNLQIIEKMDFLYEGATVYLNRKYKIYKELKSLYPQDVIESRKNLSSRFR